MDVCVLSPISCAESRGISASAGFTGEDVSFSTCTNPSSLSRASSTPKSGDDFSSGEVISSENGSRGGEEMGVAFGGVVCGGCVDASESVSSAGGVCETRLVHGGGSGACFRSVVLRRFGSTVGTSVDSTAGSSIGTISA
ncbi:hypothetical protein BCR33DRAFT_717068 [Rhizoclosmatium globosum]|uniref:Uncharacterized protein n=1 Tax=Rhizoclosmatium globosum TaxID=329046 RepID=A0A1Y2CC00_9FUNG|nr:hypothetical protein BCR33DRAFT_717068 [Rhizoclosmatium globosum]|eukprot:ORY44562.1 hypothetical protein BCR33DRAFT_717068 [Rhizoclosmatium globosum]